MTIGPGFARLLRLATLVVLTTGLVALGFRAKWAPRPVLMGLILGFVPVARAWIAASGTALRAAILWAAVAIALGVVSQWFALGESPEGGRPWAGHWAYLSSLATLAALISVLNARRPGGGAWAILMALLVLVFLIPWLEGPGLSRSGGLSRLRLDQPWTIFYWLLVIAGVTNYLPTRYAPAAVVVGLGLGLECLGLTAKSVPPESRAAIWSAVPWTLAAAVAAADLCGALGRSGATRFEATWFWFRDHWGVVWALRVAERFNRTAEAQGWGFRLTWHGPSMLPGESAIDPSQLEAARGTLVMLLRRFAEAARIERASD